MISNRPTVIMPVQNFKEPSPKKIWWSKNMQNMSQFWTSLNFGGKYFLNGWRYSKLDKYLIYRDSSHAWRKVFGPVTMDIWLSNRTHLKHLFGKTIFWLQKNAAPPNFLHTLENDQVLLAHPHQELGSRLQFFEGVSKIGLKCSILATRTFKPEGVASYCVTCC